MKSFDEEWERIHATCDWGQYPSESVIRFVAKNYYNKVKPEIKILDYGCGAGSNTWYLAREGFDTYAFDGSKSAINKVEKKLEKEKLSAKLLVGDALEIEIGTKFDCIIDNACIYANTINNIYTMYEKCYKMLKEGGKIFSTGFLTYTTGYGTGEELEINTYQNIDIGCLKGRGKAHFWLEGELSYTLLKIGFKFVKEEKLIYTDSGNVIAQCIVEGMK